MIMIKKLTIHGYLPGNRKLFLNHALEKYNENIKKINGKSKFLDILYTITFL